MGSDIFLHGCPAVTEHPVWDIRIRCALVLIEGKIPGADQNLNIISHIHVYSVFQGNQFEVIGIRVLCSFKRVIEIQGPVFMVRSCENVAEQSVFDCPAHLW